MINVLSETLLLSTACSFDQVSYLSVSLPESSLQAALHQSVFLSAMSAQPGRDLSLCWEQHRKLLPGVAGVHAETVQHWSVQQVSTTGQREKQVSFNNSR